MISIKQKLAHYAWDIAYGVYSDKIVTEGLKGVKLHIVRNPYKNKWFADPFILEEDDESIQFLVEEFDYSVATVGSHDVTSALSSMTLLLYG